MERKALFWAIRDRLSTRHIGAATTIGLQRLASLALGVCAGYGDYLGRLFLTYALVRSGATVSTNTCTWPGSSPTD